MRWLKRALYTVFILAAVYFAAIEIVKRLFDPELVRRQLVEYVKKEFGSNLEILTIEMMPFPRLGVAAGAVKMEGGGQSFSVERAALTVSPLPLLWGDVVITDLRLVKPTALLRRLKSGSWNFQKFTLAAGKPGSPYRIRLKKASISNGNITIIDEFVPGGPDKFQFTVVDIDLQLYGFLTKPRMALSANMPVGDKVSKFRFKLHSSASAPEWNWRDKRLDGKVAVESIRIDEFKRYIGRYFPKEITGKNLDFNLDFSGVPSASMEIESELRFRPVEREEGPMLSKEGYKGYSRIEAVGNLSPTHLAIDRLSIVLPEITLKGMMNMTDYMSEDPHVQFRFDTSYLEIARLTELVPPAYRSDPMIKFMEENIKHGWFRLSDIIFDGSYNRFLNLDNPDNLGMLSGKMEVKDFALSLGGFDHPVDRLNGVISLKPDAVSFSRITANYGKNRLKNISGEILNIHSAPLLRAAVDADLDVKDFHSELLKNISSPELSAVFIPVFDLKGKIGFNFNIALDLRRQLMNEFDGEVTFTDVGFKHEYFPLPLNGLSGSLKVDLSNFHAQDITWQTGATTFKTSGTIKNYPSSDYSVKFSVDVEGELAELSKSIFYNSPYIENLKGTATTSLELEGDFSRMSFSHQSDFTNAEYTLHGFQKQKGVASQQKLNGTIYEGRKMQIDYGEVMVGDLLVWLTGSVEDIARFDRYELELKLKRFALSGIKDIMPSFSHDDAEGYVMGGATVSRQNGAINYKYRLDAEIEKLNLEPFSALSPFISWVDPKGSVSGRFEVTGENKKPILGKGEIVGEGIGFQTKLYRPFSGLSGKGTLNGDRFEIENVHAVIGGSQGTVSGTITLKAIPEFNLEVDAAVLNLHDFVKIKSDDDKEALPEAKKPYEGGTDIHPRFDLKIRSKKGTLHKLDYSDMDVSFNYYRSYYTIPKFRFVSNEGKWEGNGTIDTEDGRLLHETNFGIEGLDIESFQPVLWEGPKKLTGKLDIHGRLNGDGFAWEKLRHTLNAEVEYTAKKGMVRQNPGLSAIFTVLNIVPIFKSKSEEQKGVGIPYDTITGTMKIKDGVGRTPDTKLEGSVVRMSLVGDVMFTDGTVDMTLGLKPFTTVDRILSKIPIAGKILTGEEKSLITHYYKVTGGFGDLAAKSVPVESIGRTIFGIFKRVLEIPGKALSVKPKAGKSPEPDTGGDDDN